MTRTAILLILPLILLSPAPALNVQDVSTIANEVKAEVKEKGSCWKLFHQEQRKNGDRAEVWVNWVCGKEGVVVYLYQESSVEAAAKLLYEINTSPVQSLAVAMDAPPIRPYQFGDESFVRSNLLYSSSSYVFFRKGNIVVRIDSGQRGRHHLNGPFATLCDLLNYSQTIYRRPTTHSSSRAISDSSLGICPSVSRDRSKHLHKNHPVGVPCL